jgi:LacI family transcriptional regulator
MTRTHRNPTIKDVAALAGCSVTTVSHVLNNVAGTRVKESTRERVRTAARDLAYSPNLLARGVRQHRTNTLGFVSDAVGTTPYAVRIILGAQHAAAEAGYLLMLMNAGLNADLATREIKSLLDRRVDGILYAADYHRLVDLPRNMKGIPAVLVNSRPTDPRVTSVVPDEIGGTLAVVRELTASGHRRIGYLTEAGDIPATKLRMDGYRRALQEAQIHFHPELVARQLPNTPGGNRAASILLDRPDPPTALFCFNDRMAMGAYQAAAQRGLNIPGDLSIVGFDNQENIADALQPPLTTAALPHYDMGYWSVNTLLDIINAPDGTSTPQHEVLPCPLIRRASVGPPPRSHPERTADRRS